MSKILLKGAEAIGEAAIRAGCLAYFAYPITPQSEVAEYLSKRLPEVGGTFVQAESEVAASQMVYGAAGAGVRAFTSSSSPGVSLMAEAMSYLAARVLAEFFLRRLITFNQQRAQVMETTDVLFWLHPRCRSLLTA
jgi:pyruvate/2-oxoacid:ferredoxin oxidoreductase alpha subunit